MKKHALPIIVAILLLLPVLYVGSYLAMVMPCDDAQTCYRMEAARCADVYWPLEQIDRRLRAAQWERIRVIIDDFEETGTLRNNLLHDDAAKQRR